MEISGSSTIYWKIIIFPLHFFGIFIKNQLATCLSLYVGSLFCAADLSAHLSTHSQTNYFDHCSLLLKVEGKDDEFGQLNLFLKCFDYSSPLTFPYTFWNQDVNLHNKTPARIFIWAISSLDIKLWCSFLMILYKRSPTGLWPLVSDERSVLSRSLAPSTQLVFILQLFFFCI